MDIICNHALQIKECSSEIHPSWLITIKTKQVMLNSFNVSLFHDEELLIQKEDEFMEVN